MPKLFCALSCLLLASFAGCGTRTTPVEGIVRFDGQPLPNASIHFIPQGTGSGATGMTNDRGEFEMSTINPRDGVMPGTYKVVITPLAKPDTKQYASVAEAMAATSTAPPKPPVPNFPQKYTLADQTPLTQDVPLKEEKLVIELKSN